MDHQNSASQTHTLNHSDSHSFRRASNKSYNQKSEATRNKDPTEDQLCQTILFIKEELPGRSLQKAIQMMFDYVVKKRPPEKIFCDYVPALIHIPQAPTGYRYVPKARLEVTASFQKKQLVRESFQCQDQRLQYTEKRLVAKSYVAHGRCQQSARQQFIKVKKSFFKQNKEGVFPAPLKGQDYYIVLSEVLLEAFRRLEWFLTENSVLAIKPLPEEDADRVAEILSQEKAVDYGYVIKKYLRFEYGLSNVTLLQIQSVQLYLELLKVLYGKKVTAKAIQKYFLSNKECGSLLAQQNKDRYQKLWIQKNLIQAYRQSKSYGKMFKEMKEKYQISTRQCNQAFVDILKKALKLVVTEAAKLHLNFPQITQDLFHKILRLKQCIDLRINLLDLYQNPSQTSADDLFFLVEMTKQLIESHGASFEYCQSLDLQQFTGNITSAFQEKQHNNIQIQQ